MEEQTKVVDPAKKIAEQNAPEKMIAVFGTRNEKFRKAVLKEAAKQGINVGEFDNAILDGTWLLHAKVKGGVEQARKELTVMITDSNMQRNADNQALKILEILTNGTIPASEASNKIAFSQSQVVKATTLTHKQAAELLDSLERMGKLRWVSKKREFVLIFSAEQARRHVLDAAEHDMEIVKDILTKYYALVDADETLTAVEKKELKQRGKDKVKEILL